MRVAVDIDVCGGHGVCWSLCPEVFELNDDGYAIVQVDDVPVQYEAAVRKAAQQCPTRAIELHDDWFAPGDTPVVRHRSPLRRARRHTH